MTDSPIRPGQTGQASTTVAPEQTARHLGSGGIDVYATPAMIALMEAAAVDAIDHRLPEGQASVGTALDVKHLAATPLGQPVHAEAEVLAVDGRRIDFRVRAWDAHELIGEGTHTRFVIDIARFLQRLEEKDSG
jgi:predicted thioesterase